MVADVVEPVVAVERIERFRFPDDGCIPNSVLPVLVYRAAFTPHDSLADEVEAVLARHNWHNAWRAGIFDYTHFHSNTHEVLAVVSGCVKMRLGGDHGASVELCAGDVVILPAGTGHKCEGASDDLLVVGAYPQGRDWDVRRGDPAEHEEVRHNIAQVPIPELDPVAGNCGPLCSIWRQ